MLATPKCSIIPAASDHVDSLERACRRPAGPTPGACGLFPDLSTEEIGRGKRCKELAGMVADHASAAKCFYKKCWQRGQGGRDHGDGNDLATCRLSALAARADHLEEIENHLHKAARLSRALWVALSNALRRANCETRDALYRARQRSRGSRQRGGICLSPLRDAAGSEGGGLTMATDTSRLGLGALIVRAWRIKLARIVMKIGSGLLTVAERLLPADLRR